MQAMSPHAPCGRAGGQWVGHLGCEQETRMCYSLCSPGVHAAHSGDSVGQWRHERRAGARVSRPPVTSGRNLLAPGMPVRPLGNV